MLRKIFVILAAVVLVLGVGKLSFAMMCGDSKHSSHQQMTQADTGDKHEASGVATPVVTKKAQDAGNKICPISGEKIDEKMKETYEYEGKVYNFCCSSCIEDFKKDPQKYIKKVEEELQTRTKEGKHEMGMMKGAASSEGHGMHEGQQH